jgi:hypothetical protein
MATTGDLQRRLSSLGVGFKDSGEGDFSRHLPQWLNKMPKQPAA